VVDKFPEGENIKINNDENAKVALDVEITPELKIAGHARELVRQINSLRKKQDLSVGDMVDVVYKTDSKELEETIDKLGDEVKANTLTKNLDQGEGDEEIDINGEKILITIKK